MCDDAGTAADLLERFIRTTYPLSLFTCFSSNILWPVWSPLRLCLIQEGQGRVYGLSEKESVGSRGSEHAKPFGIGDGFQQSLPQLLLAVVLGQQQHVKASVRSR